MSHLEKKSAAASAVGAKTARACDNCLRKRARWYCAADDAFLCQACDTSVHSANPLARRHERLRLKTSSSSTFKPHLAEEADADIMAPTWHRGVKRKARTPRHHNQQSKGGVLAQGRTDPLVPDLETASPDESGAVEEEQQLLYRVPIFDPVLAEFCSPPVSYDDDFGNSAAGDAKPAAAAHLSDHAATPVEGGIPGFLPSDMDLAEFSMDVDSLLGRGLDQDSFCMEELGLMDCREDFSAADPSCSSLAERVKKEEAVEEENLGFAACHGEMDPSRDTLDINFDCGSPMMGGEASEGEEKAAMATEGKKKGIMLKLDYEEVITAWYMQGSSWFDGEKPKLDHVDCWPDHMGMMWVGGGEVGVVGGGGGHVAVATGDGGREARVSRYREKRRTRLFSKKIRYEVRKLNAEKRPRMKGRFVKRASFASGTTAPAAAAVAAPPPYVF